MKYIQYFYIKKIKYALEMYLNKCIKFRIIMLIDFFFNSQKSPYFKASK